MKNVALNLSAAVKNDKNEPTILATVVGNLTDFNTTQSVGDLLIEHENVLSDLEVALFSNIKLKLNQEPRLESMNSKSILEYFRVLLDKVGTGEISVQSGGHYMDDDSNEEVFVIRYRRRKAIA